jgi:DNA-binding transcriptional MerR regulator
MATHHPIRKHVPAPEIPDKLYFRIGDVARLLEVPAYVLRFWETEFPNLRPHKGGTGQRLYRKKDVELALRIKTLLYGQGYTIPGARQIFKNEARHAEIATLAPPEHPTDLGAPGPGSPRDMSRGVEAPDSRTREAGPDYRTWDTGPNLTRDRSLSALRAELRSLHSVLSRPVSSAHPSAEGKVRPMRPRLVLEPRPAAQIPQRDLFVTTDDDPGPQAS